MANVIKCPSCGEGNPAGVEFCQFCQMKLTPPTGSLKGQDEPIKPGQLPTKKTTAELEPILPQWLRDARQSSGQDDDDQPEEQKLPPQVDQRIRPVKSNDLLAGLQSQAGDEDEEETPDWLANITGAQPKQKTQANTGDVRWVELGNNEQPREEEEEVPNWLTDLKSQEAQASEQGDANEWMNNLSSPAQPEGDKPIWMQEEEPSEPELTSMDSPDVPLEVPDWLKGMNSAPPPAQAVDTPRFTESAPAEFEVSAFPPNDDLPDWMKGLDGSSESTQSMEMPGFVESSPAQSSDPGFPSSNDIPDWMKGMDGSSGSAQSMEMPDEFGSSLGELEAPGFSSTDDLPDWMKGMGSAEEPSQLQDSKDQPQTPPEPKSDTTPVWLRKKDPDTKEVPAWLSNQDTIPPPKLSHDPTPVIGESSDAMPDWLKFASSEPVKRNEVKEDSLEAVQPVHEADTPDWLNSMHGDTIDVDTFPLQKPQIAKEPEELSENQSLFDLGNTGFDGTTGNLADLFPDSSDWLGDSGAEPSSSVPDAISNSDAISPGELPSWVQAMRPVDGISTPISSSSTASDKTLESRGALAGLQGVLPAVPGFMPTSKPKAYSIKLQATEEHLAHASLLEQILSAETEPVPIASYSALRTSNPLRWFIAAIVILLVAFPLFSAAPIFSLPVGMPLDLDGARQVSQSIPEGAPVLVAMDYEPARVGELESAAAPLLDQMILLKHPHLTFVTSNETGSMLAERIITGPLAGHGYQRGVQYLNLGYLPGGQMGIRAFAQNPRATSPMDVTLNSAWTGTPLEGINSLAQFAAIILITDDADSARTWIEQTQSVRGSIPFVVVSSAQAAPMIQPYFDSGQVSGQVAGLYGGAIFEQYNNGRPGTATSYWDSYSLGMLFAMALIFGGGLWNLFLGLRDRKTERELE